MKILVKLEIDTDGDFGFTTPEGFVFSEVDCQLWLGAFDNTESAIISTGNGIKKIGDTLTGTYSHSLKELFWNLSQIITLHAKVPDDAEEAQKYWTSVASEIGADKLEDLIETFMTFADEKNLYFNWEYGNYEGSVEFIPHEEEDVVATYQKHAYMYY